MRVVIIDDDVVFGNILKKRLNGTFKEEFIFRDGRDAIKFIDDENFNIDYIFLDMKMPKYDGWDFLRDFSVLGFKHRKANHIPIIVLTNMDNPIKDPQKYGIKRIISKSGDYIKEINNVVEGKAIYNEAAGI